MVIAATIIRVVKQIKASCREFGLSEKRINELMSKQVKDISDEELVPIEEGIPKVEGSGHLPGLTFTVQEGFNQLEIEKYNKYQQQEINNLITSIDYKTQLLNDLEDEAQSQ